MLWLIFGKKKPTKKYDGVSLSRRFFFGSIPARLALAVAAALCAAFASDAVIGFAVTYLVFAGMQLVYWVLRGRRQRKERWYRILKPVHFVCYVLYGVLALLYPEMWGLAIILIGDALASVITRLSLVKWDGTGHGASWVEVGGEPPARTAQSAGGADLPILGF